MRISRKFSWQKESPNIQEMRFAFHPELNNEDDKKFLEDIARWVNQYRLVRIIKLIPRVADVKFEENPLAKDGPLVITVFVKRDRRVKPHPEVITKRPQTTM